LRGLFCAVLLVNEEDTTRTSVSRDVFGSVEVDGCVLLCRQFHALFAKRFHYVLRSKKAFLSQVTCFMIVI